MWLFCCCDKTPEQWQLVKGTSLPWQGSCRNGSRKLRVHFFHWPQQAARTHWKLHDALKSETYLNNRLPPVRQQLLNLSRQCQDQVFKHSEPGGNFSYSNHHTRRKHIVKKTYTLREAEEITQQQNACYSSIRTCTWILSTHRKHSGHSDTLLWSHLCRGGDRRSLRFTGQPT